jgi:predicted DCC family thiol-disulfide oxidoreductase YuxK
LTILSDRKIILFDGVCNLCNAAVQFVLKRDKKNQFVFGSLQGRTGQELLKKIGSPDAPYDSFVLLENDKIYTRSSAALRVLKYLGGGWQLFFVFMIVPPFIRNGVYNLISRNRYKWFGKKDSCMVPEPAWAGRFLD